HHHSLHQNKGNQRSLFHLVCGTAVFRTTKVLSIFLSHLYSLNIVAMVAALLFTSLADAHMKLNTPEPFDKANLNNSPLAADGSDFPCKLRPTVYDLPAGTDRSTINVMKIGDPQPLSFIGSAVHGGGSCQVSLTTDPKPSKDTKWQVIHSIMGGCPANVPGNLPENANGNGATTFNYSIPDGITPGQYTLAWTWLNRIGNREFYMNCAPITVVPASKKRYAPSSVEPVTSISKRDFPSMFVANINGCITKENFDIRYPDPGTSVEYDGTPSNLLPSGQPACVGGTGPGSSTGGDTTPTSTSNVGMTTVHTVAPSPPPSSPSGAPGVFASGASSPSPVVSSPAIKPSSPSTSGALSGSCSPEGEWNCIGGTSFQRCASGAWSAAQPMAAGMTCTAGQSGNIKFATKRNERSSGLHLRRLLMRDTYA
ncbi:hypothetical protein V8E54_004006, partial [Elaphomyces granulatus]